MGLSYSFVEALVRESCYRPIDGDVLLIGRQTVYVSVEQFLALLRSYRIDTRHIRPEDVATDKRTIDRLPGSDPNLIEDAALFRLLGARRVLALDHSAYEGAEIVHDLSDPLPDHLKGCADFIVDGSTLDNVFNPALALKTYGDLLRPGGRLLATNIYSNHFLPYVMLPPHWFMDFFCMNKFVDCKVYVGVLPAERAEDVQSSESRMSIFAMDIDALLEEGKFVNNFISPHMMGTVVFAEKGPDSTTDIWPVQQHYRSAADWKTFRQNLKTIRRSRRPHLYRSSANPCWREGTGGYRFVANDFSV